MHETQKGTHNTFISGSLNGSKNIFLLPGSYLACILRAYNAGESQWNDFVTLNKDDDDVLIT